MNRENNQIRFLLMYAAIGFAIIACLAGCLGLYLLFFKLTTVGKVLTTVLLPVICSILCIAGATK